MKNQVTKHNVKVFNGGEISFKVEANDSGDTCHGDSGGPAFVTENGQEAILGITSRGNGETPITLNGFPSSTCRVETIDTLVESYIDFLESFAKAHGDQLVARVPSTPTCTACTSAANCIGGFCVSDRNGGSYCAAAFEAGIACGPGERSVAINSGTTAIGTGCYPDSCAARPPAPTPTQTPDPTTVPGAAGDSSRGACSSTGASSLALLLLAGLGGSRRRSRNG